MSTIVVQSNSTVAQIRQKVRRLVALSSESALSTNDIDQAINTFYSQDFPYAIKLDVTRSVYTFFTAANVDRYPLDVNYNQSVRAPIYVDGIRGFFFKERDQFFNMWPRWPTLSNPISGDGVTVNYPFTANAIPFLSQSVTMGGIDKLGNPIYISDDGNGNLLYNVPNPVVSNPTTTQVYTTPPPITLPNAYAGKPIPGMKNVNDFNPGLNTVTVCGTVDYVTGVFNVTFPVAPAAGSQVNLFVSQYQTGRPYSVLFWNNEFHIRPVPKLCHKIEVETYLTPVQFLNSTDNPIILQWWQYISYGSAIELLRERQDMEGVQNLMEGFKRQEALVLERQGSEEINSRNSTIYQGSQMNQGWNQGSWGWGWF